MNFATIATLIYGSLILLGGIFGYVKAKSKPSLMSGLISGLILLGTALMQLQGILWGKWLAMGVTVLLIVVFLIRWRKTRKFMPAGLMVIIGVSCLVMMIT